MIKKTLIFLIFSFIAVHANLLEKVVYVENLDTSKDNSIKEEFFKDGTKKYTLTIAALRTSKYNTIEFIKTYKMKNALAYKFGDNEQYTRIISGVYETYEDAKKSISKLDKRLLQNKPYPVSIKRHQVQFRKYNVSQNIVKKTRQNKKSSISSKIIHSNTSKESKELKEELLKDNSNLYAIAIASLPKSSVETFLKNNNISDKAIAHTYGKDKRNVRVIYGLYKNYSQAKKDIENLDRNIRVNEPYAMKMKYFQSYFKKHNPDYTEEEIVKLKVNDKKGEELGSRPKLNDTIKLVEAKEIKPTKKFTPIKKEITKPKVKKETKKHTPQKTKKPIKLIKKLKPKSREELNKTRFVKHSEIEDIYYIESSGEFNLLNEVFLNEGSSFYTIDLGEIKLEELSIEKFFIEQNLENEAVAYKYGDKKEYARAIYGTYETKEAANKAIKNLKVNVDKVRVSNIKKHQKLFKIYHEKILKSAPKNKKSETKQEVSKSEDDIVYVQESSVNRLKDEFFMKSSPYYTITLITFHKNDLTAEEFFKSSGIKNDALAFSLGSSNDYYRVIYGVFNSSKEAISVIESLGYELLKNKPYVSKIKTSKKRFESYNSRNINDYNAIKIELE